MSREFNIPTSKIIYLKRNRLNDNVIDSVNYNQVNLTYQKLGETTNIGTYNVNLANVTRNNEGNITSVTMPAKSVLETRGYTVGVETKSDATEEIMYVTLPFEAHSNIAMDINNIGYSYTINLYSVVNDVWSEKIFNGENVFGAGEGSGSGSADGLFDKPVVYYDSTSNWSREHVKGNFVFAIKLKFYIPGQTQITTMAYANVSITIKAREYVESEVSTVVSNDTTTGRNAFTLSANSFGNNGTNYTNNNVSTQINTYNAQKILNYYKYGVDTVSLEICALDYYNSLSAKIINSANGEIPKCGDIFKITSKNTRQNDDKRYIITSSEFIFSGIPRIKIEAKEVVT